MNFLHDFTLFVVDIYQIRLISLFRHLPDHFHFHGSAGLIPKVNLSLRPILASSAGIELISSSARVTSAKFHKAPGGRELERPGPINRTPETPGSGINILFVVIIVVLK